MGRTLHGDLRAALLREAAAQLEVRPASEVSLREIARQLRITHVAAYRHFADRDALLTAVAVDDFRALQDAMRAAAAAGGAEVLEHTGIAYVQFALVRPHRFRSMFTQLGRGDPQLKALAEQTFAAVPDLLPSGVQNKRSVGLALWASVHGMACLAMDGALPPDAMDPMTVARALAALVR